MRIYSLLGVVAVVASVTLGQAGLTAAFAAEVPQAQVQHQSNSGPYDSPDFVVAPQDVHA
jgi:hypothetical protein